MKNEDAIRRGYENEGEYIRYLMLKDWDEIVTPLRKYFVERKKVAEIEKKRICEARKSTTRTTSAGATFR